MTGAVLLVSGPPRAGKTVVSRLLCDRFGYEYCNIGDLMVQRLAVQPRNRTEIGPRFLSQFGIDGYTKLLRQRAKSDMLFDGLRLRAGLEAVSEVAEPFLVFKDGPAEGGVTEGREYDIAWLRAAAAVTIPWIDDEARLEAKLRACMHALAPR